MTSPTLLRLAQRHNGCRETGRPCGDPPACGCALEAAVEKEDEGMEADLAKSFRDDLQSGFPPRLIIRSARRHLLALRMLEASDDGDKAIRDVAAFLREYADG